MLYLTFRYSEHHWCLAIYIQNHIKNLHKNKNALRSKSLPVYKKASWYAVNGVTTWNTMLYLTFDIHHNVVCYHQSRGRNQTYIFFIQQILKTVFKWEKWLHQTLKTKHSQSITLITYKKSRLRKKTKKYTTTSIHLKTYAWTYFIPYQNYTSWISQGDQLCLQSTK